MIGGFTGSSALALTATLGGAIYAALVFGVARPLLAADLGRRARG